MAAQPDIRAILDPLPVHKDVKADVWDTFHGSANADEFKARLDLVDIPRETKAALWDARFGGAAAPEPAKTPGPVPGMEKLGGVPPGPAPVPNVIPSRVGPVDVPPGPGVMIGPRTPSMVEQLVAPIREGAIGRALGISTETAEARREDPSNPLIRFEAAAPPGEGAVRGAAEFASGLTTPENLLLMAGTGGVGVLSKALGKTVVSKLLSAGFSADMLWNAGGQVPGFIEAVKEGNWPKARQVAAKAGLQTLMAAVALKHAGTPDKAGPVATPTMVRDALRPEETRPAVDQGAATVALPGAAARPPVAAPAPAAAAERPAVAAAPPATGRVAPEGSRIHRVPAQPSPAAATLPRALAGAKPRYAYGEKQFDLTFASDVDRAAYITTQKIRSKRDADYLSFVMNATGMSEAQVRAHGATVRAQIKTMARDAKPGSLAVPRLRAAQTAPPKVAPPVEPAPAVQPPASAIDGGGLTAPGKVSPEPARTAALATIDQTLASLRGQGLEGSDAYRSLEAKRVEVETGKKAPKPKAAPPVAPTPAPAEPVAAPAAPVPDQSIPPDPLKAATARNALAVAERRVKLKPKPAAEKTKPVERTGAPTVGPERPAGAQEATTAAVPAEKPAPSVLDAPHNQVRQDFEIRRDNYAMARDHGPGNAEMEAPAPIKAELATRRKQNADLDTAKRARVDALTGTNLLKLKVTAKAEGIDTKPFTGKYAKQQLAWAIDHKRQVRAALEAGKDVPAEVRADYPDLKATPPAASASETVAGTPSATGRVLPADLKASPGERGSFSLKPKTPVTQGPDFKKQNSAAKDVADFFKPVITRIRQDGPAGSELARKLTRAQDIGEVQAGKRVVALKDSGLEKLSREDRQNLVDSLQGHGKPRTAAVQKALDGIRAVTDETAAEAHAAKVKTKVKVTLRPTDPIPAGAKLTAAQQAKRAAGERVAITYQRPFRGRTDFYPHVIPPSDALQKGAIRQDVIDNLVRNGIQPTPEAAAKFIDSYRQYIDSGARSKAVEQYLVDSGQARDPAEAHMLMGRFRKHAIKRQGSLEYSRQVDLPFYDPDPARVLPKFITSTSVRLAQVREFGQASQQINGLIKTIDATSGNPGFARAAVDRAIGIVNEPDTAAGRISRAVRMVNGFKLGLSFIPNATQGALNSFLKSDLPSTIAGGKGLFSKEGRRFAMQSGASLEGVITEMLRNVGTESSALGTFLKATGFTATEQANRVWAANAGFAYGKRMLAQLQKDPGNTRARAVLTELGLDPAKLLKIGKLDGDAALIAAKKFSDMTQFRSGVLDVPMFASTPSGKVIFQFKNFVYGQTRLVYRELVGELQAGRFGRGLRNFLVLATVFPLAGEAIADLRTWIKGGERKTKGLKRYFEDVAQAGALGAAYDLIEAGSYRKGVEFVAGPTGGDAGQLINIAGNDNRMRNLGKLMAKRVPLLGPLLFNRVFPPKKAAGPRVIESPLEELRRERRSLLK